MADPITPAPAPAADPANPTPAPQPDPASPAADPAALPADVAAKELERARKEAASYREKLRAREKADEERQAEEAKKRGEFEKLYGTEKTRADDLAKRLEGYERAAQAARERDLATLPESVRKFAPQDPEQFAEFIAAQRGLIAGAPPPAAPKPPAPAPAAPRPADPSPSPKRTYTQREINEMSFAERQKAMPDLLAAAREGRITD